MMLKFILQKIRNKKWMVISLLLGNLLMISVAAATPMYSQAVMQRALVQDLGDYQTSYGRYPATFTVENRYSPNFEAKNIENLQATEDLLLSLVKEMDVPSLAYVRHYFRNTEKAYHEVKVNGESETVTMNVNSYSQIEEHIKIAHGQMFSTEVQGNVLEAIVSARTFAEKNLTMGEVLELPNMKDNSGTPYRIKVVGVFDINDPQDPYWVDAPSRWDSSFLISETVFREICYTDENRTLEFNAEWYHILDYTQMRADRVEETLELYDRYEKIFQNRNASGFDFYCQRILLSFLPEAKKLNSTIVVLQVPIFVLLAAFIFMVSRQMLEIEQNEISVFKSRGASKGQILMIYLLQSVMIAGVGILGGIPLGVLICKLLGSSNEFLEFVQRTAMPVRLVPGAWFAAAGAAVFSVATMVLPVFRFADVNIVAHKRQKNRINKSPWWQKIFLDVVLLVVGLYGWFQFRNQEKFLAQQISGEASMDPVLYFSSSVFMLGAGLLVLRLIPLLVKLIYTLGKKWWPPARYASFLRILRSNSNQGFLVVFLVLTVAMGIFNTQTARAINSNAEDKIRYSIGADVVLQEQWTESGSSSGDQWFSVGASSSDDGVEPDFGKYTQMEGIESVTKVLSETKVSITTEQGSIRNAQVMGIHTKEFGETAWFKESLLPIHWHEYLNIISQNSNAILVSSNFREVYGYKVGDTLQFLNKNGDPARGVIYGFVEYWPGYSPKLQIRGDGGVIEEADNFLVVAHLSQLQSAWGITPYQVWIKAKGSTQFLYDYAAETGTKYTTFRDAAAEVIRQKNDPIFQGTNSILTISFIVVLLLCATGFLIYWILSIQSRTLQFGIFRAMGMSKHEIWTMLLNEQFFISGMSILGGVLVGSVSAGLYAPLIQAAYSSADKVIPLEITSRVSDFLRLGGAIGLMVVVCLVVLGMLISKIKIAQALKLGED